MTPISSGYSKSNEWSFPSNSQLTPGESKVWVFPVKSLTQKDIKINAGYFSRK